MSTTAPAPTDEQSAAGEQKAPPVLYDVTAEQRMPFQTERKGVMYNVAHIFGAIKDEDVMEYERRRDQRISDADTSETDDQSAMAVSGSSFEAAVNYWNTTGARAEGYASTISEKDKAYAVQTLLFGVEWLPLPSATADEACPPDDEDTSTHRLRCMFNGQIITCEHTLNPPTPEQLSEFQRKMSRAVITQGTQFGQTDQRIPSRARYLGDLYEQVKLEAKGYAGRIPLHHKMAVVLRHFRTQQKVVAGNA